MTAHVKHTSISSRLLMKQLKVLNEVNMAMLTR